MCAVGFDDNCSVGTTPLYLEVPFEHRDIAKHAGAWWDPGRRQWYVPPGREVNYPELEQWIPIQPCPPGQGRTVNVLGLPITCYACHGDTTAVVGLDPGGHDGFATTTCCFNLKIASMLLGASLPHGVGHIKQRRSRTARASYLSNGCSSCDALIGEFPLGERLAVAVVNDRRDIVVLGRGEVHPLLLEAALASAWIGG